ncbi:MAG TPA: hypothetical protein VMN82_09630 [Thermoanaerobaculia bacterium]|nr:hypothetical protein [Thermoanaerobaculia bacterium]
MLRYRGVASEEPERCVFRITDGDGDASAEALDRVARIAAILLQENGLSGVLRVAGPGRLALELPQAERGFFHNGIVFAALDAINDPVRNPTLTLRADEKPR